MSARVSVCDFIYTLMRSKGWYNVTVLALCGHLDLMVLKFCFKRLCFGQK